MPQFIKAMRLPISHFHPSLVFVVKVSLPTSDELLWIIKCFIAVINCVTKLASHRK